MSSIPHGVVKEFRGEYAFLSNYYQAPMQWRGINFHSAEQAFAYAKTFCAMTSMAATFGGDAVLAAPSPGEAKKAGRSLEIDVKEWDQNKVHWMREIVHAKFATAKGIVGPLINTGAMMLVEGNTWGDKFWGRCLDKTTGKMVGLNTLGVLLMEERGYWLHNEMEK